MNKTLPALEKPLQVQKDTGDRIFYRLENRRTKPLLTSLSSVTDFILTIVSYAYIFRAGHPVIGVACILASILYLGKTPRGIGDSTEEYLQCCIVQTVIFCALGLYLAAGIWALSCVLGFTTNYLRYGTWRVYLRGRTLLDNETKL